MTSRCSSRKKPDLVSALAREAKEAILDLHVRKVILERTKHNGNLPSGFMAEIVSSLEKQGIAKASRHTVYNHEKRLRLQMPKDGASIPSVVSAIRGKNKNGSDNSSISSIAVSAITDATLYGSNTTQHQKESPETSAATPVNRGGRPKGTTLAARIKADKQLNEALEFAATKIIEERSQAKSKFKSLPKGSAAAIIEEANVKFGLKENNLLNRGTVMSRVNRKNPKGHAGNPLTSSPMAAVEPVLAALCLKLVRSCQPLDATDFLDLATSLVAGTETEAKIREHHKKSKASNNGPLLSKKYYHNFLKRHGHLLQSMKASNKDNNRQLWGTFHNMQIMYDVIYKELVEAGIAKVLDAPRWMDVNGNEVETEEEAYGCRVQIEIIHPNYFIMGDETGCNTNMKTDGNVGGKKYMGETGRGCNKRAITTDIHFTVLPFTNGLGEPVMCSVIFTSSEKNNTQLKSDWITGIDVTVDATLDDDGVCFITNNSGVGKYMPSGPTCTCNGIEVPCYVAASPHGGITSDILTDMLRYMDDLHLFERGARLPTPFLLMDGHGSRFDLPFLQYVSSAEHEWAVCIGVPYGTHLWQVGDASSMNGCFKIGLTKAKSEIMRAKQARQMKPTFLPTDIIPIVNKAWSVSFGNKSNGSKALAERGWNPCNRALLKHKDVLDTKIRLDESAENVAPQDGNESTVAATRHSGNSDDPLTELSIASAAAASQNSLNLNNGKIADVLDILASERNNVEARRRALDRRLKSKASIASFDKTKKLTAGKLVAIGRHRLNGDVTRHQVEYVRIKVELEKQRVDRKRKAEQDILTKVAEARSIPESEWKAKHFKTMCAYKKTKTDPALAKKIDGLKIQWEERRHRLSPTYEQLILEPVDEQDELPTLPNMLPDTAGIVASATQKAETQLEFAIII